jgi:hypothetical protein
MGLEQKIRLCIDLSAAGSIFGGLMGHGPRSRLTSESGARAYDKVRRVARTIADIDGAEQIGEIHLAEARGDTASIAGPEVLSGFGCNDPRLTGECQCPIPRCPRPRIRCVRF